VDLTLWCWTLGGNSIAPALCVSKVFPGWDGDTRTCDSQLARCVDEWVSLGGRVCMFMSKFWDHSLCLIQAYILTQVRRTQAFVEETSDALRKVKPNESTIFLEGFGSEAGYSRVWLADMMMLTQMMAEGSCCNYAVRKHYAWTFSSSTEMCTIAPYIGIRVEGMVTHW